MNVALTQTCSLQDAIKLLFNTLVLESVNIKSRICLHYEAQERREAQ